MSTDYRLIYLHAITPIHSGTGQDAAVIDLPIARERATGWPFIPASSLKGVLKSRGGSPESVYGSDGDGGKAGDLCFADQRILCLPVRSFFGTFAYVTCPLALSRLLRDARAMGIQAPFPELSVEVLEADALTCSETAIIHNHEQTRKIYLEDLDLTAERSTEADAVAAALAVVLFPAGAEGKEFKSRFAIVSNDIFNFLSETATEVSARIVLGKDSKTSKNLWYEEAVPAEAIFCGALLVADHARNTERATAARASIEALKSEQPLIQVGGKASVGRGLCRVVVA